MGIKENIQIMSIKRYIREKQAELRNAYFEELQKRLKAVDKVAKEMKITELERLHFVKAEVSKYLFADLSARIGLKLDYSNVREVAETSGNTKIVNEIDAISKEYENSKNYNARFFKEMTIKVDNEFYKTNKR